MIKIRDILAENLKKNRRLRGLTQEQFAEKANVSSHYIAMVETCKTFPTPEMLERLATALEVEAHELLAAASSADNELALLRKDIIREVETLNESLAKTITDEVINAIKQTLSENKAAGKKE